MLYVLEVAPPMFTPFFRHWNVGDGVPVADTENEADDPVQTVCGDG